MTPKPGRKVAELFELAADEIMNGLDDTLAPVDPVESKKEIIDYLVKAFEFGYRTHLDMDEEEIKRTFQRYYPIGHGAMGRTLRQEIFKILRGNREDGRLRPDQGRPESGPDPTTIPSGKT